MRVDARWLALLAPLLLAADPQAPPAAQGPAAASASAPGAAASPSAAAAPPPAAEVDGNSEAAQALDLEARRAALQLLQSDLAAKLDELAKLQTAAVARLEAARAAPAETEAPAGSQGDVQKLVTLYQAMKPKNAARLLERLPLSVSSAVLGTMKTRPAGKIMNELEPKVAAQISKRLAEKGS